MPESAREEAAGLISAMGVQALEDRGLVVVRRAEIVGLLKRCYNRLAQHQRACLLGGADVGVDVERLVNDLRAALGSEAS